MKRKMIVEYYDNLIRYTVERKFLFWWIPAIDKASMDWLQEQIIVRFLPSIPDPKCDFVKTGERMVGANESG